MVKSLRLKSLLLLCALMAGSGSVWAEETIALSWSRSGTTNSSTTGFAFSASAEGKSGYYQDGSGNDEKSLTLYNTTDKLFSSTPSTVSFHAKLGGGSTRDLLNNSVYACFVDNTGAVIDGSSVVVTTKITNQTGSDFSVSMPVAKAADAYGVKIYHTKETGYNVRYYSFSLGFEAATASAASAPEFSLTAGAYAYGTTVALSSTNSKKIYYTTNGDNPTTSSTEYSAPIAITSTMTIKALAIDDNNEPTIIVSRTFSVKSPDAPTFSPTAGNVAEGTDVTISVADGCVINYTTDGTDPSTSGTATMTDGNSATVTIDATTTIRAIAIDGGLNESSIATARFVVLDADAMTESKTSFTATSGDLVTDGDISFAADKGGGTTNPAISSSCIRLYQISGANSYGGYITLTAPTGFKIVQVKITSGSANATTVTYTVDGSTTVTTNPSYSLAKSSDYTIDGLYNSSVSIFNLGTSNSNRLDIAAITVMYVGSTTTTLASACTDGTKYYGTYSHKTHAVVIPDGVTASEIKVESGKLVVSNYAAGAVVPANTGVMLSSTTAGDKTIKFTGRAGSSVLGSDNMLKSSGDGLTDAGMIANQQNASALYYRLTMHNGTQIGFWWGADKGAAFSMAANKAYLAVPASAGARLQGFAFGEESTGIAASQMNSETAHGEVYNLQGQRVVSPKKGLYIVNGKKAILK